MAFYTKGLHMTNDHDARMRIGAAAKVVGVTPGTIRRWLNNGQLWGVRTPGHRWLVERESIERLLAKADNHGN
jgi:excisionase family DNA binding protein